MSVSHLGMERMSPALNMFLSASQYPVVPPRSLATEAQGAVEDQFIATADRFAAAAESPQVPEALAEIGRTAPEASAALEEVLSAAARELGTEARLVPSKLHKASGALPIPEFRGIAQAYLHEVRPDGTADPNPRGRMAFDTTPGQNGIIFLVAPQP